MTKIRNNLRFSSLQWILFHLLEIIIIIIIIITIIIIDKWSVEYSIIGHNIIMGTLWSWCKKADGIVMRLPLSDGLGHHPSSSIARLGFPAKQLWLLTMEGLSWIHDVWWPRKIYSHIKVLVIHFFFLQPHSS